MATLNNLSLDKHIANFLKFQENIKSISPHTIKAYRTDLKQLFNSSENQKPSEKSNKNKLDEIYTSSEQLWSACRSGLNNWGKLSLSSRNRKIAVLKSFFNFLFNEKIIDKNLADQLVCPKVPKKIPHFISVDEVMAIIQYLNLQDHTNTSETHQQKILFYLLYGAGLRISEACQLKWNDIHFELRRLLILGKGQKERLVIAPPNCMAVLKKYYLQNQKDHFVFGKQPLSPRLGYEYIRKLGLRAGLMNPLHPHALRHSFATHLLASGANLRILQSILGHESLQATEKYTHLSVDLLARTVESKHPLSKKKLD